MPTPIRNPFAPPPAPQPKPRKLKTKREEPEPLEMSPMEIYEQQLAMYERAKALVKAFLVYHDSVFGKEPEFIPTEHSVRKLLVAQKDNIHEYHKLCTDEDRGFNIPKSYMSVLLQICQLINMAVDAKVISRKEFSSWLPSTAETNELVKTFEDFDFHSSLPPPVRPKVKTPPPIASSSKGPKRKKPSSGLDISDSEPKPPKRSKIQIQEDSFSEDSYESEHAGVEETTKSYGGEWSYDGGQELTPVAPTKTSSRRQSPSPEATVTTRNKPSTSLPKGKGKDKASAPKPKGKDKTADREKLIAPELRGPVSSSGQREAYHPPAPPHPDEDDGYVADVLSTAGGHVYLQGNVQLSYDSVISATSIAPEPNFYTQGCDRCIQKGLGCSPRADGHAGCTGCKSTNQKCSFTQSLKETLAARDEQLDLGLQGHNGLVLQLEGLLSTTSSLQGALDMQFLATQHVLRLNQQLERQRILFLRSTRDPRVICALLRLLHPNEEALTNERLVVLLTALRVPHSSFDLQAAGFKVCGKEILVVDMSTDKTLATYQQVVSLAESAFPPVDLAKWLEARVGPEYVIKDKAAPKDTPGSPMAQDSKLEGPSSSPAKASGSTVKTASPRSVLDVPPSSSNIKDSKTEKKGAGSKSPMAVEKVGGSSSGDRIVDKSLCEKSASPDSE
ncbi:hypothetical protein VNI00_018772 [Paramarasmius palmivorus]|uniref:Zn(2)-C6 fungal-type domain-containing protein n=1 Tax=Paramarasmius palmivorus TaxID=297713 RepID=A0AAW0AX04_9AGAR